MRKKNGPQKLTEEKVAAIKAALRAGHTQREIAEAYGVSQSTIAQIYRRALWRRVR